MDDGRQDITDHSVAKLLRGGGVGELPFEGVASELIRIAGQVQIERTRDAIQIICEPLEIGPVMLVTPEAVEFRLPTIRWIGPHTPVPTSTLWRRVCYGHSPPDDLDKLIASARTARRRQFKTCRYCKEKIPPEHRHSGDVCHGCAERHLGVVH